MKLIEDDYAVLRKFRGQSSLKTYLVTVVQRLALDYQIARFGKWRPSVHAMRLGEIAVQLETLLYRDQHLLDEAVQILLHKEKVSTSEKELRNIAEQIPPRSRYRPRQVEDAEMKSVAAPADAVSDLRMEKPELVNRVESSLKEVLAGMNPEDRLILKMRFESDLQIAEIARALQLDQKKLYRRIVSSLQTLREGLEKRGISAEDISDHLSALGRMVNVLENGKT